MIAAARAIGAARLGLLVVGQGQDAQREDLVDLGRVAEVAGALRRDRRVVVEDDRRRQHDVVGVARRRPAPGRCRRCVQPGDRLAPRRRADRAARRTRRRRRRAACARRPAIAAWPSSRSARPRRPSAVVFSTSPHLQERTLRRPCRAEIAHRGRVPASRCRIAPADHDRRDASRSTSTSSPAGNANACSWTCPPTGQADEGRRDRSRARPPRPTARPWCRRRSSESTGYDAAVVRGRFDARCCTWRQRIRTVSRVDRPGRRSPRCASTIARRRCDSA